MEKIKSFREFNILEDLTSKEAEKELQDAFQSSSVSEFVEKFKKIASDPKVQAILKAGRTDGREEDEQISYKEVPDMKVGNLLPTQSEIGFDQSIENILTDQYGSLKSILAGKADVGGPIVTYNGKWIIDGHHRWSQVFAANPDATMESIDIRGDLEPQAILVAVHAAIAATLGEVPSTNPQGINILKGIKEEQVAEKVKSKLTDKAREIWSDAGFRDDQAITKQIYDNLEIMIKDNHPEKWAPGRKDMPQTDAGDSKADIKLDKLKAGLVNFHEPKAADVKTPNESIKPSTLRVKLYEEFIQK